MDKSLSIGAVRFSRQRESVACKIFIFLRLLRRIGAGHERAESAGGEDELLAAARERNLLARPRNSKTTPLWNTDNSAARGSRSRSSPSAPAPSAERASS